jgi:hypothetical protein
MFSLTETRPRMLMILMIIILTITAAMIMGPEHIKRTVWWGKQAGREERRVCWGVNMIKVHTHTHTHTHT